MSLPPDLLALEDGLVRCARKVLLRSLRRFGGQIDRAGYVVLGRLEGTGAMRLSDLAAHLELDLSTVSRQVRILEELGLVVRHTDPDDRRASRLELSEVGRAQLSELRLQRHTQLDEALQGWPAQDRARLVALISRLADSLESAGCTLDLATTSREVSLR